VSDCGRASAGLLLSVQRRGDRVVRLFHRFTEHFDVNYEDWYVRRGPGSFRRAGYPAAF